MASGPVFCRIIPVTSGEGVGADPLNVVGNRNRKLGAFSSIIFILQMCNLRSRKAV